VTSITNTKVVESSSEWEPTNKTISIRETTRKRLQSYGTHYGSTYDSIITQILDEKERKAIPEGEGSF
jgi:hypothetical protein